jgi:hypothetical protein
MHGSRGGESKPFYERPLARIVTKRIKKRRQFPKVEAEADDLVIFFRIIKAGYASSLGEAKKLTAREIIQALNYETFLADYEDEYLAINAPEP